MVISVDSFKHYPPKRRQGYLSTWIVAICRQVGNIFVDFVAFYLSTCIIIHVNNYFTKVSKMQIREQGRQLQCIRTEYVPEKKRTYGRVVAKQNRYLSTITDEVRQLLTEEEVDELETYLSKREERESVARMKGALSTVNYYMSQAAIALSVDELKDDLGSGEVEAIYRSMEELTKALRKAGFKRPVKAKATKAADDKTAQLPFDNR